MDLRTWTYLIVGVTFAIYIAIAIWAKTSSTKDFYVAGGGVHPIANGMATGADWMSAASFISMAGLISFLGRDGSHYLMGWTGGYVLLALLLAPYLRKFGKFTVPDFVGDRYYSNWARGIAVMCAIFISFTYIVGQMRGVGVVFSRFLEVEVEIGLAVGMTMVFVFAVLGGMKGITYTQVAQYCVLIFAFLVPAVFISLMLTGNPIPQLGFGSEMKGQEGVHLLERLDGLSRDLGFAEYTLGQKSTLDMFCITMALMVGTAGLPHIIVRFYTVPKVSGARASAGWALIFIALLYTTAPAVAAFARTILLQEVPNTPYTQLPNWFKTWEDTGLIAWVDKDGDGEVDYLGEGGKAVKAFAEKPNYLEGRGEHGQRLISNTPTDNANELYIDRDIIVLANPEIADLPNWVIGLVTAGGLAAALSTAAGLLLVISTSVARDLVKRIIKPGISEKSELWWARGTVLVAVVLAGVAGLDPPGFVAQVVAFAFGLAAASFFPAIVLGIFSKRVNREGVIAGMLTGLAFTAGYIILFKMTGVFEKPEKHWLWGISPEGIGTVGMIINFVVTLVVTRFTPAPPLEIQHLVEEVRVPRAATSFKHGNPPKEEPGA